MDKKLTVTLDGPAGVGKTTLAKRVADALNVAYLDTGAMFRTVAWMLGEGAWDCPEDKLREDFAGLKFTLEGQGHDSQLRINGAPISEEIRTEKVGLWASNLATIGAVREFLKEAQQAIGRDVPLVVEGRDMGTVVFPEATHKFFLDATPEERARRRCEQLRQMGKPADFEEITLQIKIRDAQDRNRPIAPLRPADDAEIVDTTKLDIEGVFKAIMKAIKAKS